MRNTRHAEAEATVEWTDDVKIARACVKHRRIRAEQREPSPGRDRSTEPDECCESPGHPGTDPRRMHCTVTPPGAHVRADHRHERAAEPEDQRNEQILEA